MKYLDPYQGLERTTWFNGVDPLEPGIYEVTEYGTTTPLLMQWMGRTALYQWKSVDARRPHLSSMTPLMRMRWRGLAQEFKRT